MTYTKVHLPSVEDSAAKYGFSESQQARFPRADLGAEQTGLNYLVVKPGKREAFAHKHETAEELLVVLAGDGRVKLDEEVVELEPLDCLRIGPGVTRLVEAGAEGISMVVVGPHVEGDGEMLAADEFWS